MKVNRIYYFILSVSVLISSIALGQNNDSTLRAPSNSVSHSDTGITDMGVAVSPSNLKFRTKPGSSETKYITITNDTRKFEKFKISFRDYDMTDKGGVVQVPQGKEYEYGLTKMISVSPSFVELKPGEAVKVAVTLNVPDSLKYHRAGWCLIMIDQATEKKYIIPEGEGSERVVMGVIPVFGFGVYVFQNPPNVSINKVEISKFLFSYDTTNKFVTVYAKNVGTGLGFCKLYVELNNLNTGYKEKLFVKQFTIFPEKERILDYVLPGNIEKGNYIATAVLDFGSKEEVEAAELEFKVE